MAETEQTAQLLHDVARDYSVGGAVRDLSGAIRSPAEARAFLRVAYAQSRGSLLPLSIAHPTWEAIYAGVSGWDDAEHLGPVVLALEMVRDQLAAYRVDGRIREEVGVGRKVSVLTQNVIATYAVAAR